MRYLDYVNIKMGTDSSPRFSRGNTLPLTQLPFGMASFSPQSERLSGREAWFFSPNAPYLEGIRLTHQPSPWIGDYGTVLFTPQSDGVRDEIASAYSGYKISESVLMPHYQKINFLRPQCTFELSPTERGAKIRLTFERETGNFLSVFKLLGNTEFVCDKKSRILYVTNDHHLQSDADNFKMHLVVRCEGGVDFDSSYEAKNGYHLAINGKKAEISVALSYISRNMAEMSLENEIGTKALEEIKQIAEEKWEEKLSKIEIDGNEEELKKFYSCMYRCFLFPHKAYELNENKEAVHYSPWSNEIKKGERYTDTGFWDTYRTQFPLFSIIEREEYEKMLRSFLNDFYEGGFLPRWTSLSEVGCMPSTLIDAVIADAVVKGIGDEKLHSELLLAMLHHANNKSSDRRYGREGIDSYLKFGYVPCDFKRESVNLTLDFAYGDWCISQVAKKLGKSNIATEYEKRSKNYISLFNEKEGFICPKDSQGKLESNFDPISWGQHYTEGSAWQSLFSVPHDLDTLKMLLGGKEKTLKKLDLLFSCEPKYRVGGYGSEIHEMTEMATVSFGQCAISNQPSFSLPYLYAYYGNTEKTEKIVSEICSNLFTTDAFPGDEDNGSMSAWYIFSQIGKYPLTPGKDEYIKIKPLAKNIRILGKEI